MSTPCLGGIALIVGTVGLAAVAGLAAVGLALAVAVAGLVATVGLGTAVSLAVAVPVTLRGGVALGGGTILISVFAPGLGSPLVIVSVVPFIIGLGVVGLGPSAVVRLLDAQVLVSAPGIPVRSGSAGVTLFAISGGGVVNGTLVHTFSIGSAVATVSTLLVVWAKISIDFFAPGGGGVSAGVGIAGVIPVVILSPLVIIGLDGSGVGLVVIRLGTDSIVGLAPSGVVVGAVGLLGPLVVVVGTSGGLAGAGGTLPVAVASAVAGLSALGVAGVAVALTVLSTISVLGSLASTLPVLGRGGAAIGGGAIDVSVLAPSLGAPLVVVLVVPLIVRLSGVGLGLHLVVGNVLAVVLIASPSVPVGARFAPVACALTG